MAGNESAPAVASGNEPLAQPEDIAALVEDYLCETADMLRDARAATEKEISHAVARVRESDEQGIYLDFLQALAIEQGHDEENLGPAVMALADKISELMYPVPETMPFAGKLIIPASFYASFDQIYKTAFSLLAPVVYVEDTDSIGVGSVNPIAAKLFAPLIRDIIHRRFGIRPFMSVVRMDYDSWIQATKRHFGI